MTLLLALAIAATSLTGVAVLLLGLLIAEGRAARAASDKRHAATIAVLERFLRLTPGTIERDIATEPGQPAARPRRVRRDEEAERRAEVEYAIAHGLAVPSYPPATLQRGNQPVYLDPVEIR